MGAGLDGYADCDAHPLFADVAALEEIPRKGGTASLIVISGPSGEKVKPGAIWGDRSGPYWLGFHQNW